MRESGEGLSSPSEGRRGKSGTLQWVCRLMYLIGKHLHLITVLVRLYGTMLMPISQIYAISCKFYSFTSPEPSSCMHVQRVQTRSAVNVERPSASAAYAEASFTVVSEQGRQLRSKEIELQRSERIMANPEGHILLDEEQAHATEECYARMEAMLQELQQQNQELQCCLQE